MGPGIGTGTASSATGAGSSAAGIALLNASLKLAIFASIGCAILLLDKISHGSEECSPFANTQGYMDHL